jgi:hypothetical protein
MRNLISNTTLGFAILVTCILFSLVLMALDRNKTFEFANSVVMAASAGIAFACAPASWKAMKAPAKALRAGQVVVVALFIGSIGDFGVFGSRWLWRAIDRPDWLADHWLAGMSLLLVSIERAMILASAHGSDEGEMTPAAWRNAALVVAGGALLSATLFSYLT